MLVEQSLGDVVDRITILRRKVQRARDPDGRHVARELAALESAWQAASLPPIEGLAEFVALAEVNAALWDVEDALRQHEARCQFDGDFVNLARSVYRLNDERAALKRRLNERLGSELIEVKVYGG